MTTKRIQNTALAGVELACRYERDARGRPAHVKGDEEGVFELPERDADFLLTTPGWRNAERKARALPPALAPAPSTKPKLAPPTPGAPPKPPASPPGPESKPPLDVALGGDVAALIDGLRSKADAQAFAETWRAKGYEIEPMSDEMLLRDMKAHLVEALLTDADEDEDEDDEEESDEGEGTGDEGKGEGSTEG